MSIRPSAESPISQNKSQRKRRQAEVVSFEDLLAAHQTDRESGKLPPEGVVLIGVDTELQLRMRAGLPNSAAIPRNVSKFGSPNFGTEEAGAAESSRDTVVSIAAETQDTVLNSQPLNHSP